MAIHWLKQAEVQPKGPYISELADFQGCTTLNSKKWPRILVHLHFLLLTLVNHWWDSSSPVDKVGKGKLVHGCCVRFPGWPMVREHVRPPMVWYAMVCYGMLWYASVRCHVRAPTGCLLFISQTPPTHMGGQGQGGRLGILGQNITWYNVPFEDIWGPDYQANWICTFSL